MKVKIVGIDPAFANFGIAQVMLDTETFQIEEILGLTLIKTEKTKQKSVKVSNDDLKRARELHSGMISGCQGCCVAVMEVPGGSQSARAAKALGVAVGVMSGCPIPVIEVDPYSVKLAAVGKKTASKQEMIDWATECWPDAPWIKQGQRITLANEHLADALATIKAGVKTAEFRTAVSMLTSAGH